MDVHSSNERKGDFRFAIFISTTVKLIFWAEAEDWELIEKSALLDGILGHAQTEIALIASR